MAEAAGVLGISALVILAVFLTAIGYEAWREFRRGRDDYT